MVMETQTYLLFRLNDVPYGIQTTYVREIFQLPELTPIADAPDDIIGILNFRGTLLPVMHLAKRLGQTMPPCHLQDRVIVVEWEDVQVGMVVHQVDDVQLFPLSIIEPEPTDGHISPVHTAFVVGVVKIDDWLITLLNPATLIRQSDSVPDMLWEERLNTLEAESDVFGLEKSLNEGKHDIQYLTSEPEPTERAPRILSNFFDYYCPNSTPDERQILHHRAQELSQIQIISNTETFLPLAVMRLGDEYLGLNLDVVKEFITIRQVTPIPCCPSQIIGDINLRGEVVTIVDIRKALSLNSKFNQNPQPKYENRKAIIVQVEEVIAGIIVDQVLDVIYVPPTAILSIPTALSRPHQELFQGVVSYEPKPVTILGLRQLFYQGDLVIDQAA